MTAWAPTPALAPKLLLGIAPDGGGMIQTGVSTYSTPKGCGRRSAASPPSRTAMTSRPHRTRENRTHVLQHRTDPQRGPRGPPRRRQNNALRSPAACRRRRPDGQQAEHDQQARQPRQSGTHAGRLHESVDEVQACQAGRTARMRAVRTTPGRRRRSVPASSLATGMMSSSISPWRAASSRARISAARDAGNYHQRRTLHHVRLGDARLERADRPAERPR